jgi:predicted  nucleic acid-binding Zn-ribbon protein
MIEKLLAYQSADAKLREIEKKLGSSEEKKKAMSAKKYLEGVDENVNKLDARAAELIGAYESATKEQIKLQEQQAEIVEVLNSAEDEKEAEYLIKKVEELISKIKSLGAKASKIADEIQSVLKEYSSIKKTTQAAQVQYKENAEKYNELKKSVQSEKDAIEKELESLKKDVDPALMNRYLKKRENKIYPILYEVKGGICGACRMELSMLDMNKLKNGQVIDCDQCGRMLYLGK